MVETIMKAFVSAGPDLRKRYLQRVRSVGGVEARQIEARLMAMIERDRRPRLA